MVIVTSWMPDGECAAPRLPVPFLCVRNNSGLVISVLTFDVRFALMLFSPWMATLYFSGRNLSAVLGTIE